MSRELIIGDIYNFINSFAPFNTAEDFDNVGLLVGDKKATITKALVCLDCTEEVIAEAIKIGANLIISHHPIIFSPLKKVLSDSIVYKLIQNSISVISAHTNLDIAPMGVADNLACKMELKNIKQFACGNVKSFYKLSVLGQEKELLDIKSSLNNFLTDTYENNNEFIGFFSKDNLNKVLNITESFDNKSNVKIDITESKFKIDSRYYGRIGSLPKEMTAKEFANYTKEKLNLSSLQFVNTDKKIKTVATLGGSGGSFMFDALKSGADAFVTGDIKHNIWLDAKKAELCLVDAGHFQTEICVVPALKNILQNQFGDNIFFISQNEQSPFEFI